MANQKPTPLHNEEVERALISLLLVDPACFLDVDPLLMADDFYVDKHRCVYEVIAGLWQEGVPVDVFTVRDRIESKGLQDRVDGAALIDLSLSHPVGVHPTDYARIVRDKALLRRVEKASVDAVRLVHEPDLDVADCVAQVQRALHDATQAHESALIRPISEAVSEWYDALAEHKRVIGLLSGFDPLDDLTGGFHPGDLHIAAGRPGMGKTSYMMSIGSNVAFRGHGVLVFSLEMSTEQLVQRAVSGRAQVDMSRLRHGAIPDAQWAALTKAVADVAEIPMFVAELRIGTVEGIRALVRQAMYRRPIHLVIVDYLQLLTVPGRHRMNLIEQTTENSKHLKALAREMEVPLLVGSQLSRACEQRIDKHPILSDLRESGSIEQDADTVHMLYREDYYNPRAPRPGVCEIEIAKQRNGPTGRFELFFDRPHLTFYNVSHATP